MRWLKPSLQQVPPYHAVHKDYLIKLDANESEHFLFQTGIVFEEALHRYPDNHATALKDKLAHTLGINNNQCLLGAGSSDVIDHVIKSTVAPGETILTFSPTFVMYQFYAKMHNAVMIEVPLEEDYTLNLERFSIRRPKAPTQTHYSMLAKQPHRDDCPRRRHSNDCRASPWLGHLGPSVC
jgi:histidinol-phosphate aminotransferase